VGLVHHIRHRSCWTIGDYLYLQDLFVSPEARGAGIGRKLIEYVYELGRAEGCARVHWLTHETNTDAMLLYDRIAERSGFVQYRRAEVANVSACRGPRTIRKSRPEASLVPFSAHRVPTTARCSRQASAVPPGQNHSAEGH
jgi:hypothetical protein